MSRKGSVPVTILVIGVFAVCGLALITFFISEFNFSNSFAMVDDLRALNVYEDEWNFYSNHGSLDSSIIGNIKFPISSEDYSEYSFSINLEGDKKIVKIERIYKSSLSSFLFSKGLKSGDLVYSIEYSFD